MRKIIQLISNDMDKWPWTALCDDGTVWNMMSKGTERKWIEASAFPAIPQPEAKRPVDDSWVAPLIHEEHHPDPEVDKAFQPLHKLGMKLEPYARLCQHHPELKTFKIADELAFKMKEKGVETNGLYSYADACLKGGFSTAKKAPEKGQRKSYVIRMDINELKAEAGNTVNATEENASHWRGSTMPVHIDLLKRYDDYQRQLKLLKKELAIAKEAEAS